MANEYSRHHNRRKIEKSTLVLPNENLKAAKLRLTNFYIFHSDIINEFLELQAEVSEAANELIMQRIKESQQLQDSPF